MLPGCSTRSRGSCRPRVGCFPAKAPQNACPMFEPSRATLAKLADTEADPKLRARYARILDQLKAQVDAVSKQDFDNADQTNLANKDQVLVAEAAIVSAEAQIQVSEAGVETAGINLGFTRIVSPIDGIAGVAQAQVGDLVNTSSGVLTTVSTVDPIRDYFAVSEQEYLALQKRISNPDKDHWKLQLILADGTTYSHPGEFYFADRQVNQNTGAIQLAALFANPGNVLRPGQYG